MSKTKDGGDYTHEALPAVITLALGASPVLLQNF